MAHPGLSSARHAPSSGELSQHLEAISTTESDREAKHLCLVQAVWC